MPSVFFSSLVPLYMYMYVHIMHTLYIHVHTSCMHTSTYITYIHTCMYMYVLVHTSYMYVHVHCNFTTAMPEEFGTMSLRVDQIKNLHVNYKMRMIDVLFLFAFCHSPSCSLYHFTLDHII